MNALKAAIAAAFVVLIAVGFVGLVRDAANCRAQGGTYAKSFGGFGYHCYVGGRQEGAR